VRPYLEKTLHKNRAGGVAQGEGPEFKPQYHKKVKQKIIDFTLYFEQLQENQLSANTNL
jgi:hypothetical protein